VITAFEIQVLNNGDWKIDSIFDDEELATYEANRVFGRGAYDAVRVVQENYNETTDTTAARTVAELTKAVAQKVSASRSTRKANKAADEAARRAAMGADNSGSDEFSLLWWVGLIARSVGIAIAGLVVLFLLRLLYEM